MTAVSATKEHFNLHSAAVASAQIGMKEADSGDFIKM